MKLSLKEAQDYALKNNAQIKNAKLDIVLAKKKVWETTAIGLPHATGTANYSNILEVPEMNFGGYIDWQSIDATMPLTSDMVMDNYVEGEPIQLGTKENVTFDFNVSQLVFSGEYIVGLQASKIYKKLSEQNLQKTEADIKELIINTYYLVLIAEKSKEILESTLTNTEKIAYEIKEMLNVGFVEDTDFDQIELTLSNIKNSLSSLERQVGLTYKLLKMQLGLETEIDIELTDNLDDILSNISYEQLLNEQFFVENNIDYKLITTQENLSNLSLKREKSTFLPSVAAFYNHEEQMNKPEFNFSPPDIFGLNIEVPLLSSGMKLSKVSQAKIELEKVRNTKWQVEQNLILGVEQAKSDLKTNYEEYLNLKQNLELAKKIYEKTLTKYQEGISTSFDLTQVHNQYLTAQSNYFNKMIDLLKANSGLNKLLYKN
jgi:outer membrane protein TolC